MISTQDIKQKEVINIYDGKSLGFVEDLEVNLEKGTIEGIIIPVQRSFFSFFGRNDEQVIKWRDIKRIGDDVILVDVSGGFEGEFLYRSSQKNQGININMEDFEENPETED
ncbi:YlmC/YmxH family sporulation protein [Anaerovorax sp. IOR16]|uniref:YlmC/YmxH family sporulation protein n=1 Tax=Anaerovorax sp. IOR16 TaxID=2773458 RepID=UPI0019CF5DD5|nr:YlmC/YmxH family sporulation protein [Anaerovorax sp. IOR16]